MTQLSTMEISAWCNKCYKYTMHMVQVVKPRACLDCLKRLENPELPGINEPHPEQMNLLDAGSKDVG